MGNSLVVLEEVLDFWMVLALLKTMGTFRDRLSPFHIIR